MRFGPVPLDQAEGAILAHSVPLPGGRLRKGVILDAEHLARLRAAGRDSVTVARLDPGDVHEDAAAARLGAALLAPGGTGLRASRAATGRVNLYARTRGVLRIDVERVQALNRIDPAITLATLPPFARVDGGAMVATLKIIAYGVDGEAVARGERAAVRALSLAPPVLGSATLIQTVTDGSDEAGDKGLRAIRGRLDTLGVALAQHVVVSHAEAPLAGALAQAPGDLLLILTGSATSDSHDVAPSAVRAAGGSVAHYGMPVDPGNLLFLGEINGRPVIGLPGCAKSPALNGADWVLERIVCGIPVGADDIMAMGVGGLLKEIPSRPRPREG